MIWEEPIYKERSLSQWLDEVTLPPGIEQLVPHAKLPKAISQSLPMGALLLVQREEGDGAIAGVLNVLRNHADDVICLTASQAHHGLTRRQRWNEIDFVVEYLEAPDIVIVLNTIGMMPSEERILDRALVARSLGHPKVTVLVGKVDAFPHVQGGYGKNRTYEIRTKTSKKST